MWRPDRAVQGPVRAQPGDVDALNRVFSDAFTDRYARDGMGGVRVPFLNPAIWRYAFDDAGDGAMLWRDAQGQICAFNMVHRSGREGWMGPLAVRPDRQGSGLGRLIVETGVDWLRAHGCTTIGLETMPRTVENIGFYSRIGFVPGPLTITLAREVQRDLGLPAARLSARGAEGLAACRALTEALAPGIDFERELQLTLQLGLGDATLVDRGGRLAGFALWHSAPLAAGRARDELRVLKLVAEDLEIFARLLEGLEHAAGDERVRRVAVRCQAAFTDAYRGLVARGYRVQWTDLRMTLADAPEIRPPCGVVFSNWEI
jgi:GNAT superfamily N-acetyltransferase